MNIIGIDIGNTNIKIGLWLQDNRQFIETIHGSDLQRLKDLLISAWDRIPVAKSSKERKKDGIIAAVSVCPENTKMLDEICEDELGEKVKIVGRNIPLPIEMGVDETEKVGTDRVVSAAAAFAVVEDAVMVADFGTAVTVDLVDEQGVFLGGVIYPGFAMSAKGLREGTAQLPDVRITRPRSVIGANTNEAINAGVYYGAIGMLETVSRLFAEQIGKWPQLIATGSGKEVIKQDCPFVNSWVDDLVVQGVVLAYKKFLSDKDETAEIIEELRRKKD